MKRRWLPAALFVTALAAGGLSLVQPGPPVAREVVVDIPRGTGSAGMARTLAREGLVRYPWQFLAVRVLRPQAKLQAGEYAFRRAASPWEVFDRLARGDVFYRQLTVPEGHTIFDIAESLDRLGAIGGREFLEAARDVSAIRDLAPGAPTLEGFLFPDTYRITRNATASELCARMTGRFRKAWAEVGGSTPALAAVTLASLIEKETAVAAERPLVASVFANRLRIGMPLDCDPTAIYAALLEGRYRGAIFRSDLDSRHRYNTYQHAGLPPGPIANPGLESLRAALAPAATKYLYFVAEAGNSGAHVFSEQLEAHQRAVAKYRRAAKQANKKGPAERVPPAASARPHR